jgi:hypothetical protein
MLIEQIDPGRCNQIFVWSFDHIAKHCSGFLHAWWSSQNSNIHRQKGGANNCVTLRVYI